MSDKRDRILESAKALFLEQGYQTTSIQSIADKAQISKGAIYIYFKSKQEILLAILSSFRRIDTSGKSLFPLLTAKWCGPRSTRGQAATINIAPEKRESSCGLPDILVRSHDPRRNTDPRPPAACLVPPPARCWTPRVDTASSSASRRCLPPV